MRYIDIRSDTVTHPTDEMRRAMATAEVGDDVYRDDPTTNRLEELAAKTLGFPSALFVSSGTMGNQLSLMSHTSRGDEVIVSATSHIVMHEVGAAAVLSGVSLRQIKFENDIFTAELIEKYIRPDDIHEPPTKLICVENALANGRVVPLQNMAEIHALAKKHNLPVHMDGARVFNAATALGVDVREITKHVDSVSCCLSKGLCAPVGAVLAGSEAFINKARKYRKMLGGGMRQTGILAAAGIIALTEMPKRLHVDHENAKYLACGLSHVKGVTIKDAVEINMVFFTLDAPMEKIEALPDELQKRGILINGIEEGRLRFVTNNDVTREDADAILAAMRDIFGTK